MMKYSGDDFLVRPDTGLQIAEADGQPKEFLRLVNPALLRKANLLKKTPLEPKS